MARPTRSRTDRASSHVNPCHQKSLTWVAVLLLVIVHGVVLSWYFVPVLGDSDANGYLVAARQLRRTGSVRQELSHPLEYVGEMWVVTDGQEIYPKYPPLYPVLVAGADALFGDGYGMWVSPACALLAVVGAFVLARCLVSPRAALLVAVAMATNPLLNSFAIRQHSHAPSIACLTWAFALFFLGRRRRGAVGLLCHLGSGLLLGYSAGIRYPDLVMALPIAAWFAARLRTDWRPALAWATGLAVPCSALAVYHALAFGSPFATAYSLTDEQSAFHVAHLVRHLRLYVPGLFRIGLGPLLLLACCGFALTWARSRREGLFYSLWLLPMAGLYMAYYWAIQYHEASYMRFFLPLIPPLLVLAVQCAGHVASRFAGQRRLLAALTAILVACQLGWGIPGSLQQLEERHRVNQRVHQRVEFIRSHAPAGSVVFSGINLLDSLQIHGGHELYLLSLLRRGDLRRWLEIGDGLADGPDAMQTTRARSLCERLLVTDDAQYHAEIAALVAQAWARGKEVYVALLREHYDALCHEFAETFTVVEVAMQPPLAPAKVLFSIGGALPTPGLVIARLEPLTPR